MDTEDDFEIDPAIAAAMGFAGFGNQKKRKFDSKEDFVDPDIAKTQKSQYNNHHSTGANSAPLGAKKTGASVATEELKSGETAPDSNAVASESGPPSLEALRQGVRNENGDMVYFKPSFLEDPWTGLQAR